MSDVNTVAPAADPGMEWPEGDLPEQMGGLRTTLLPGLYDFRLPSDLSTLWKETPVKDTRQFLATGAPNPTFDQQVLRLMLKLDRNTPLLVVGGPHDNQPMTWTASGSPRPRGKKDVLTTAWISDLHYLLGVALQSPEKPKTPDEIKAAVNKYANAIIRLETGLTAQCNPENVRYIMVEADGKQQTMKDPSGKKGCGRRFYTKDFKNPQAGPDESPWDLEIACDCGTPKPEEAAAGVAPVTVVLRAFEQVERILPPMKK